MTNQTMESEILNVAEQAVQQPDVTGYICVDKEGLCLAAKGQARQSMSGVIHQLASLASKIEEPNAQKEKGNFPVIRVDLERYRLMIQTRESITTALISSQK